MTEEQIGKIKQIEKKLDNYFSKHEFMKLSSSAAIQYLLLTFEYAMHNIPFKNSPVRLFSSRDALFQRNKNSLMESIKWAGKMKEEENHKTIQKIEVDVFRLANDFFELADKYHAVVSAYTMWYRGIANAKLLNETTIHFEYSSDEIRYDELDRRLADEIVKENFNGLKDEHFIQLTNAKKIVEGTVKQIDDFSIAYSLRDIEIKELMQTAFHVISGFTFIPKAWRFYNIGPEVFRKFWAALISICMLNLVATQHAFKTFHFKDNLVRNAVIIRHINDWIRQLYRWTKLPKQLLKQLIEYHTYFPEHKNADIVLTPFIYVTDKYLALAPTLIATNNLSRNLLKHAANNYKDEYDCHSYVFAQHMLEMFKEKMSSNYFDIKTNINIPARKDLPDIDLCLIDAGRQEIMFCECRWTIPAADPKEVADKIDLAKEKLKQAGRLREFIFANRDKICDIVKTDGKIIFKNIYFTVIFQNHVGSASTFIEEIPTVDMRIFMKLLGDNNSLSDVFNELKIRQYLPKEDIDFTIVEDDYKIGDYKIIWTGFLEK